MEKIKKLINELRELNTNDPAMQRRIVAVLEVLFEIIEQQEFQIKELENRPSYHDPGEAR